MSRPPTPPIGLSDQSEYKDETDPRHPIHLPRASVSGSASLTPPNRNAWIIPDRDPGYHLCNRRDLFIEYTSLDRSVTIKSLGLVPWGVLKADEESLCAAGIGSVEVQVIGRDANEEAGVNKKVRLTKCLYVPMIEVNLVSERRLEERGWEVRHEVLVERKKWTKEHPENELSQKENHKARKKAMYELFNYQLEESVLTADGELMGTGHPDGQLKIPDAEGQLTGIMSIIDSKHGLEIACARSSCLLRDYHVLAVEGNDTLWPPHVQRVDRKPFQSDFQIDDISSLPNHTSSMQQTLTNGDNSSTTKRTSNTYHSTHPAHRFIHFQNNRTHHQTPLPTTPVPELAHLQILGPPSNPTPSYITAQLPCHPHFSNSTPTYTHRAPHLSPPNTPATPPAQWSAALAHLISSTATSALRTSSPLAATLGRKREFEQRDALARLEGRRAFIKRSEDVEEAREVWERGIKKQYGGGFGVSERGIVEEEESALAEGSGMGKPADTLAILGRRRREVRPRGGDGLDGRVKTLKRMGMVGNLRGRARTEIESALREGMGTGRVGDVEGYGNMDGLEWGNGTARPNTTGITRDEDGVWTTEGQDKLSNNENSVRQEKGGLKKLWARFRKLFSQRREREGEGYIDHDI